MAHATAPPVSGWFEQRLERWELAVYAVLLAYFAARITYLAVKLGGAVPPDEMTHLGRVFAFGAVAGIPDDGPGTYELGLVSRRPWLYYWLMGRVAPLNFFPLADPTFLRLLNGLLGVATAGVGIAWMRSWCPSVIARVLFAVLATNTLMFTGLAAAVSYDNLANLLAAGSLWALTRFRSGRSPRVLLVFCALLFAGCLAKRTFLPLAFLLALLLASRERSALRELPRHVVSLFRPARPVTLALVALVAVFALFTAELYGGNVVRYGKLRPDFDQIVGVESAMRNRVYARARILEGYRTGELTFAQAEEMARQIRHRGDRSDTLVLLRSADRPDEMLVGPFGYASQWMQRMLRSTVGYLGHRRAFKSRAAMAGYMTIFVVAGVLLIRRWRPGQLAGAPTDALLLALGYAGILMWLVNHPTYLETKNIELAVQGRYLFPVFVPIYGLVAYYLIEPLSPRARPWVACAVAGLYVWGDLPWLVTQLSERWLQASPGF